MQLQRAGAVCVITLVIHIGCTTKATAPTRPSGVPPNATWAGGPDGCSFFECDTDAVHNVNRCLVYDDYTGDVEGGGFFRLADANRAANRDELRFRFYDGDRIVLEGHLLVPVLPVRPNGLSPDAVLANGLFISCGQLASSKTNCSIYRPDGGKYFSGEFEADASTARLEYKFFALKDRTIHLIGGDRLVAR